MQQEKNLWQAFKNGERAAMKIMYEDNVEMLFSYGKRLIKDDLQVYDHIHDTFVKLWEQREKINEPNSIKGYLVTMFRNHIIDGMRKNRTINVEQNSLLFEGDEDSIESKMIFHDDQVQKNNQLTSAIEKLTTNQKEIIYLKYKKEMSYEEIASVLNINYQSVRNLAHRAITELRKHISIIVILTLILVSTKQ